MTMGLTDTVRIPLTIGTPFHATNLLAGNECILLVVVQHVNVIKITMNEFTFPS